MKKNTLLGRTRHCGCASKLPYEHLKKIISRINHKPGNAPYTVGTSHNDDAAILENLEENIVVTTDIGTPIFNDPVLWGEVYTYHVLSDVFAMGGTPVAAVMQLGVPLEMMDEMLQVVDGVQRSLSHMNTSLIGGHTFISEQAPILGLTAIGKQGNNILHKATPLPGDDLIITKPIGIGICLGAHKEGALKEIYYEELISVCTKSNSFGINLSNIDGITSCTDITGWGLLGEVAIILQSGVGVMLWANSIPLLSSAYELSTQGYWTSIGMHNYETWGHIFRQVIDPSLSAILSDPQTSGGLLFTCRPHITEQVIYQSIAHGNLWTKHIGKITSTPGELLIEAV